MPTLGLRVALQLADDSPFVEDVLLTLATVPHSSQLDRANSGVWIEVIDSLDSTHKVAD